jgi:hypothetical protein
LHEKQLASKDKSAVGQAATVLQLPARPMTAAEADAQKRASYAR